MKLCLCWQKPVVTGSHLAVYSATCCTKEWVLLHVWVPSDIKVTLQVHNPALQDQGQPSMHGSIIESSKTFIPPQRENVLSC
jgi:hypothetical protein